LPCGAGAIAVVGKSMSADFCASTNTSNKSSFHFTEAWPTVPMKS
jgi:hypothetical protein